MKKKKIAIVLTERCVACGTCVPECPKNAISVKNGVSAVIDADSCIGCGKCIKACPAYIIEMEERADG